MIEVNKAFRNLQPIMYKIEPRILMNQGHEGKRL